MGRTDPFYRVLERTTSRFALLADGDDGASGGGGGNGADGDGAGGGGNAQPPAIDWGRFAEGLRGLNTGTNEKLDQLIQTVRDASQPQEVDEPPVDLDGLSREQLVSHIVGTMARSFDDRLTEALTPLVTAINNLQTNTTTSSVTADIKELKASSPDFDDWKGDMANLSQQHPTLNVHQLYALAKGTNPTKAAEVAKKYAPAPKPPTPKWGGLTNTGTALTGEVLRNSGPTTGKDATMDALKEVADRHPVLAGLLNS